MSVITILPFLISGIFSTFSVSPAARTSPGTSRPADSTINVQQFGAIGDGITNDTKAIQSAIDYASNNPARNKVLIPSGTYLVNPIFLKSNITIVLTPTTIIKSTNDFKENQRVLNIISQSNIIIKGNGGTVTMDRSVYNSGEQRFGLWMNAAKDITVDDLICKDCGGDGFCIGGFEALPCQDIILNNCKAFNNRRNGLSITNAINVKVLGGEFSSSNGTAPMFGIDLEPDSRFEALNNILIKDVITQNNQGGGISVVPGHLTDGIGSKLPVIITIEDCQSINDGKSGGLFFANAGNLKNKLAGSITIKNFKIINPKGAEINYLKWSKVNMPVIHFQSVSSEKDNHITRLF